MFTFVTLFSLAWLARGEPCMTNVMKVGAKNLVPVTDAVKCLESIEIPKDIAIQTVEQYDAIFDAGYTFYSLATNATDSDPLVVPEGWSVYTTGEVDLHDGSQKLVADISANGANGMLPFKLTSLYRKARDKHTGLVSPAGRVDHYPMFNGFANGIKGVVLVDMEELKQGSNDARYLTLKKDANGDVKVVVRKVSDDDEKVITQLANSGDDVLLALVSLAFRDTFWTASYKSPGVVMNAFLELMAQNAPYVLRDISFESGDFSILPESIPVTFDNGDTTEWRFFVEIGDDMLNATAGDLSATARSLAPNAPYSLFNDMVQAINSTPGGINIIDDYNIQVDAPAESGTSTDPGSSSSPPWGEENGSTILRSVANVPIPSSEENRGSIVVGSGGNVPIPSPDGVDTNLLGFDWVYGPENNLLGGIAVFEDTMILRLPSFEDYEDTVELWERVVDKAVEKNVTHLLIDLVGNMGGVLDSAFYLINALYPEMTLEELQNQYSHRISPTLGRVIDILPDFTAAGDAVLANADDFVSFLEDDPSTGRQLLAGLYDFAAAYLQFQSSLTNEEDSSSLSNYLDTLGNASVQLQNGSFNPETLGEIGDFFNEFVRRPSLIFNMSTRGVEPRQVTQGGSLVNVTGFYPILTENTFATNQKHIIKDLPFETYTLLSNGASGSSASIFEHGVRGYSKKNPQATPATGVTFGCLGSPESCPLSQFSGGSLGESFEPLIELYDIAFSYYSMLMLLAAASDSSMSWLNETQPFIDRVDGVKLFPQPPFGSGIMPHFTGENIFTNMITPETIPMEYFNVPADITLDIWPRPGTYLRGKDTQRQTSLPELYSAALASDGIQTPIAAEVSGVPAVSFSPIGILALVLVPLLCQ